MQEQKNVSKMGFIRGLDIFASADKCDLLFETILNQNPSNKKGVM